MAKIKVLDHYVDADISRKRGSEFGIVLSHGANNNMSNELIEMLFSELKRYCSVLRFNFSFVDGSKEKDAKTNIDEIRGCMDELGCKKVILVGKSYGAKLSAAIAVDTLMVKKVINLGYPLYKSEELNNKSDEIAKIRSNTARLVFIIGAADPLFDIAIFRKLLPSTKLIVIEGADHSFGGKDKNETLANLHKVVDAVTDEVKIAIKE